MDTSAATVRPHAAAAHPDVGRKKYNTKAQENHPIIQ